MCSAVGKYRRRDGEETLGRRALRTESGHGPTARSAAAGAGASRAGLQEEDGRRQREPGAQGGCRERRRHQDVEPSATGDAAARGRSSGAGAAGRRAQPLAGAEGASPPSPWEGQRRQLPADWREMKRFIDSTWLRCW